ncbi:MAG: hypothetical protein EYC70_10705 [Planctomycetota bacterium]|nr:MAG: hypothetical protein EYC70_10705 [Planctomycetota bacterium]
MHLLSSAVRPLVLASAALATLAALAAFPGCGPGGSSSNSGGDQGSGDDRPPRFSGIGAADAITPADVTVSWPAARNFSGPPGSSSMIYKIYRALDAVSVLDESSLIFTTAPGVTVFADRGLPEFTTFYYRVEAVNTSGLQTETNKVTSARTPSQWMPGLVDYAVHVAPLWDTTSPAGNACLSCHDGSPAGGRLDLGSYAGVMIGTGTSGAPDSFVLVGDGAATWNEFLLRFTSNPLEHVEYDAQPSAIAAMQAPLTAWADEGALEHADGDPPVFEFDNVNNAGKYYGDFTPSGTVSVTFFHAADPESLPFGGDTTGQLEYHVYGGVDGAGIDWLNPAAMTVSNDARTSSTMTVEFSWPFNTGAFVVRAIDRAGGNVTVPAPDDPDYLELLALRRRNMSFNEREIVVRR